MPETRIKMDVRKVSPAASIIELEGDFTGFVEGTLMQAYSEASGPFTRAIILNFTGLQYMNSSGIGLLVTLLVRANRQKQRLLAYGLSEHYTTIFEITQLTDAIGIFPSETEALAAAEANR